MNSIEGAVGEVPRSDWRGMKQLQIGQAQAWLYPQDRTLVLWECFLEDWCRAQDPRTDETLTSLSTGFEQFLLRHLPKDQVERIASPSWEPIYGEDKSAWQEFLISVGYRRIEERAFGKDALFRSDTQI